MVFILNMSSLLIEVIIRDERGYLQREHMRIMRRNLRDSENPFEVTSDEEFINLYRFPKYLCKNLIDEIIPFLLQTSKIHAIPSYVKVLSALRFFSTGSYQRAIAQDSLSLMSQTSVSRCVTEVAEALNKIGHRHIKFPSNEEPIEIKRKFFEIASFPGVIGLVDGTHIKIIAPNKEIEHVYYCRKGGHSKNVQIVCDADYIIRNVNARFGGTAHDAYIWRRSQLKDMLEQKYCGGERNLWLLGDSGYPLQPWLMTPISTATSSAEQKYNCAHKKTRCIIEKCIGVLKSRFRCLSKERTLCYTPPKAGKIINACVVLHNILMKAKTPIHDIEMEDNENNINDNDNILMGTSTQILSEGRRVQSSIINTYFN